MSATRILCPRCGSPPCRRKCEPDPGWVDARYECPVVDGAGARIERLSQGIEEMAEKCRNAPRYRDRIAGCPLEGLKAFVLGMGKPPWWRFVRRWKWRKLARNMCKPQPGLSGWTVIDCRNAPGRLSDVVYVPEEARYGWDKATKSPGDRETGKEETK